MTPDKNINLVKLVDQLRAAMLNLSERNGGFQKRIVLIHAVERAVN